MPLYEGIGENSLLFLIKKNQTWKKSKRCFLLSRKEKLLVNENWNLEMKNRQRMKWMQKWMDNGEWFKKVQNPEYFQLPGWCVSPRGSSFRSLLSLGVPHPTKGKQKLSEHSRTALDYSELYRHHISLGEIKAFRNAWAVHYNASMMKYFKNKLIYLKNNDIFNHFSE